METINDRLLLILGDERLATLRASRVMVLGLGGVGSSCAEALARGGVGSLVLVDRDVVRDINPSCDVCAVQAFIDKDRVAEQLGALPRPDYVVDAIDTVSQKLAIATWCQGQGIPEVSAMGGANKLDPTRLRFAPIEKTQVDPLARIVRKECRKRGIRGLTVLYSDEQPLEAESKRDAIDEHGFVREGQSILGTMSYFPPIMGQMLAGYVLRGLTGLL